MGAATQLRQPPQKQKRNYTDEQIYLLAHARGALITGTFTPTQEAAKLTTAPHFNAPSTPIVARFSSSTGLPEIPDTDPNANPRGFALRFQLGPHKHTDIIAHSTRSFPTRTGAEFLDFLRKAGSGDQEGVKAFLSEHPETGRFLADPKPSPVSFGTELYFGVNAFKFINADGKVQYLRYRIVPVAGVQTVSDEELKTKEPNYLFDELHARLAAGPVEFKLVAQLAEEGDITDNATVLWPDERKIVELGTVKLEKELDAEESKNEQKVVIFDPIPRVAGIEPSDDPLLEVRANVYLISGKERRAA